MANGKYANEFEACFLDFSNLPEYLQQDYASPWGDDDEDTYLVLKIDGEITEVYCDGGESEDATFTRDLSWIDDAINKAYMLGRTHARREAEANVDD